jgi:hypothetical protein
MEGVHCALHQEKSISLQQGIKGNNVACPILLPEHTVTKRMNKISFMQTVSQGGFRNK